MIMIKILQKHQGYNAGHPWYYRLGGDIPKPKQILQLVQLGDYRGYAEEDIKAADTMAEPKRSEKLKYFKKQFEKDLKQDLAIYRQKVVELNRLRKDNSHDPLQDSFNCCDDVYTAMSLKFSHLINDFAHLVYLEELLSWQIDLFDF